MKKVFVIIAGILFAGMALATEEHGNHEMEPTNTQQTLCPVMEGNPIDANIYVDYRGERVFFCCNFCVEEFQKSPEKYISKLPQFTAANEHAHEAGGFKIYRLTKPLGIATFALLILTLCAGIFRRKLKRRFLRIHQTLAATTVVTATLHLLTVWIGH
jgi:YHS domain-containing protein